MPNEENKISGESMTAYSEFRKAIQCLYIELDSSIVDDVKRKADVAIKEYAHKEAIVFGEWCLKNYQWNGGTLYRSKKDVLKFLTFNQLYSEFKSQK